MKKKKLGGSVRGRGGVEYPTLSPREIARFASTLKGGERLEVLWIDAFSERGWKTTPEMSTAHPCAVVGHFINCRDGYIRLGVNRAVVQADQWPTYSDHWGIPLGMIYGLEVL